jgi:hypothetical protein
MSKYGISESDLKPAFLFLSSCETDLARQAKLAQSTVQAAEHHKNAQTWLQKVYGLENPVPSRSAAVVPHLKATNGADTDPTNKTAIGVLAQQRILEREILSLQDRQHQHSNLLSETRIAKRKLEDDLEFERDLRYRLQRRLDDTRKELETARRMETYALDQVKREVEARRRAEDMAKVEKNHRLELQKLSEEQIAQPVTGYVNAVNKGSDLRTLSHK